MTSSNLINFSEDQNIAPNCTRRSQQQRQHLVVPGFSSESNDRKHGHFKSFILTCFLNPVPMDLYTVLPDFPVEQFNRAISVLEKTRTSVKEVLVSDPLEISKLTRLPVTDLRNLKKTILERLHRDLGLDATAVGGSSLRETEGPQLASTKLPSEALLPLPELPRLSTLDPSLDLALDGGISTGYVTEIAGES